MDNEKLNWQILFEKKDKEKKLPVDKIIEVLLENRGIRGSKERVEFLNPVKPEDVSLAYLKINKEEVKKAIFRLKTAFKNRERVIIYGDYDADGICGTAILWETLYGLGFDVWPYIPERFSEGYGVNFESVEKLKKEYPNFRVLITVDNGIVANEEVDKINKLGIDVIVTDHHQAGKKKTNSYSTIHTTDVCGSAVSWIFSREIKNRFLKLKNKKTGGLDLVAIGTIADQVALLGANRSFAKWGLRDLNNTNRSGLLSLFKEAGLTKGEIGTYEVGYIIAPRINATGRIEQGIDSLRLLCTKSEKKSLELARKIGNINQKRKDIVDKVVEKALNLTDKNSLEKVLIIDGKSFHEGVIGLAAGRLVEVFYRPAIVISKGEKISKASARSIPGFNIIENIRKLDHILLDGGGHPMAAGFSILTKNINKFKKEFIKIVNESINDELLLKKVKIDMDLGFKDFSLDLINKINTLEPFGIGNPFPVFITENVEILDKRLVGKENKHLKLILKKDERIFDAIAFNMGDVFPALSKKEKISIAYSLDKNFWDGRDKIQIKVRSLR